MSGSASGWVNDDDRGIYTLHGTRYDRKVDSQAKFALSHHVHSFDSLIKQGVTSLRLHTTAIGMTTSVTADQWQTNEYFQSTWVLPHGLVTMAVFRVSPAAMTSVNSVTKSEVEEDVISQRCLNSMYATHFGMIPQYIQGINMIPQALSSSLIRSPKSGEPMFRNMGCCCSPINIESAVGYVL